MPPPAAPPPVPVPVHVPLPLGGREHVKIYSPTTGELLGMIVHKPTSNDLYALCLAGICGGKCVKTRRLLGGTKPQQGRPLGYLVSWLLEGASSTALTHKGVVPTFAQRVAAREWFKTLGPDAAVILSFE